MSVPERVAAALRQAAAELVAIASAIETEGRIDERFLRPMEPEDPENLADRPAAATGDDDDGTKID